MTLAGRYTTRLFLFHVLRNVRLFDLSESDHPFLRLSLTKMSATQSNAAPSHSAKVVTTVSKPTQARPDGNADVDPNKDDGAATQKPAVSARPADETVKKDSSDRKESTDHDKEREAGSSTIGTAASVAQAHPTSAELATASSAIPQAEGLSLAPSTQQSTQQAVALTPETPPNPAAPSDVVGLPIAVGSLQNCKKPADCPSRMCLAGICAVSSGFETQTIATALPTAASASLSSLRDSSYRGPQTACSDPRCHLPADLKGLNVADDTLPPAGSSNAKLLSDAGIAGLVLALLFVVLFLLLVVPKVRSALQNKIADWKNKRDAASAGRELGNGSPDFGNEDASTFEKRNAKYTSSFVSPGYISGSPLPRQHYAEYFEQQAQYDQQAAYWQYSQPPLHEALNMESEIMDEKPAKARAVSFAGPDVHRKAISFADDLQRPTRLPTLATDGTLHTRRPIRETVLPYTVGFEEDRDALAGLRGVASPLIQNASK